MDKYLAKEYKNKIPGAKEAGKLKRSLSKSWVEKCNSVGNQRHVGIINRTVFPLVAKLKILGVTYQTCEVPPCDDEDARNGNKASFAVGKLPCGLAWYTVQVQAYSESTFSNDKVFGPENSLNAVYGGSQVTIHGSDPRYLKLTKSTPVEFPSQKQSLEDVTEKAKQFTSDVATKIDSVMKPISDSFNEAIDDLVKDFDSMFEDPDVDYHTRSNPHLEYSGRHHSAHNYENTPKSSNGYYASASSASFEHSDAPRTDYHGVPPNHAFHHPNHSSIPHTSNSHMGNNQNLGSYPNGENLLHLDQDSTPQTMQHTGESTNRTRSRSSTPDLIEL